MTEDKRRQTGGVAHSGEDEMSEAEIDYNVMGSFPASDPPSWTLGVSPHKGARGAFDEQESSVNHPSHQNETTPPAEQGQNVACPVCGTIWPKAA